MLDEHPGFSQEIIEKIETDSMDWQKFAANCSNHLILPIIYLKFQSHGIIEYLPKELSEYLKEVYDLNYSRNNQILEELQEITEILNKGNIYPVFLKGAGNLLDDLYSNIGERILGDIDLLVPEKEYLLSAKLLEDEGYSKRKDSAIYFDVSMSKHYPRISKPGFPASLEIHRLPVKENNKSWFNPCIIDQGKKTVIALKGCCVLSDNHKIIHNFIHAQLDHQGHTTGLVYLRDLYDLYLLSKRTPIKQTLTSIKKKRKAIVYFAFAGKALGLNESFYSNSNFSIWFFSKRHDLILSSVNFNHTYRTINYITRRVIIGYTAQIIKSFYSKNMRQSVIHRLSDHKWYRARLQSYVSFFARKK